MKEIKDLVVGDTVIITNRFYNPTIGKVTKLLTNYLLVGKSKFRYSGSGIGDSEYFYIEHATPEAIEKIKADRRRAKMIREINDCKIERLPIEKIEEIYNLIRELK